MTGIDVAPVGQKRYYKYFKHLAKSAKKVQLKEKAQEKLAQQIEKTKKAALEQQKKKKLEKEFELLEMNILNVLAHEKQILYKEGQNTAEINDLKNSIKELKQRQEELARERAFRFNMITKMIGDLDSKFSAVLEREARIKHLEKKIKGKVKEMPIPKPPKPVSPFKEQLERLEAVYEHLKPDYPPSKLEKIKKKIEELKKKI